MRQYIRRFLGFVNRAWGESEGELDLTALATFDLVEVVTENGTVYTLVAIEPWRGVVALQGGREYPAPTLFRVSVRDTQRHLIRLGEYLWAEQVGVEKGLHTSPVREWRLLRDPVRAQRIAAQVAED